MRSKNQLAMIQDVDARIADQHITENLNTDPEVALKASRVTLSIVSEGLLGVTLTRSSVTS